jgi:hypothetical protein
MADKKNKKKQRLFSLSWEFWLVFIIFQLIIGVGYPFAVYVGWPSNDRNTQTVVGEIEEIKWAERFGKHRSSYVRITLDGEEYRVYPRYNRKETHSREIEQALAPGDIVEISYKTGYAVYDGFKPHRVVIGLKDQEQAYRKVEVYDANARMLIPVFSLLMLIVEALLCLPFYAEYLQSSS